MAKELTLLEKAKNIQTTGVAPSHADEQRIELALAYTQGEVTAKQCAVALGCSPSNIYQYLGRCLVSAVRSGKYKIIKSTE